MLVRLAKFLLFSAVIWLLGTVYSRPEFRQAIVMMLEQGESGDYESDYDASDYDEDDDERDNDYAYDDYDSDYD